MWGKWYIEALGDNGRYWGEELMGGLLVVEQLPERNFLI